MNKVLRLTGPAEYQSHPVQLVELVDSFSRVIDLLHHYMALEDSGENVRRGGPSTDGSWHRPASPEIEQMIFFMAEARVRLTSGTAATRDPAVRAELSPSLLKALGLTKREAEVLYWVTEGKRNDEIGVIIGAQSRTIAKHLERIFEKLSVETRTAAAAVARDLISPRVTNGLEVGSFLPS